MTTVTFSVRLEQLQTRIASVRAQRDITLAKANTAHDFGLLDMYADLRERLADFDATLASLVQQRDVLQASYWED